MNIEKAIREAMRLETKIRDLYIEAHINCDDPIGKQFFATLRDDEQYHHDFLTSRLEELQTAGKFKTPDLEEVEFQFEETDRLMNRAKQVMAEDDRKLRTQMLSKALEVEKETSGFYEKMVSLFSDDAQKLFKRFMQIENNHIEAVQIELDYVMKTGYWFDFKEFDME
jgi:rubrerythrin